MGRAVLAVAVILGVGGCLNAADSAVDTGKTLYSGKCASCHGKDGKGAASMAKMLKTDAAALDLTDDTLSKSDADLLAVVVKGKNKMPAYETKLKAEEISSVMGFMRTLGTPVKEASASETPAATSAAAETPVGETLAAAVAADGAAGAKEAPPVLAFEKTGKLAVVKFDHKGHADLMGGCAVCHEGAEPIFAQKRSAEAMKMADMYAGKTCGSCHDGKKKTPDGSKPVFAAKMACPKCHKK